MPEKVLRMEDVTMQFGGVVAVNNLSLEVNRGEIVALIGPNGAGKTTAFNCVTGVYEPTNGIIRFCDEIIVANHPRGK
jgi:branched-chain amino acid transport system ATP-binding protein